MKKVVFLPLDERPCNYIFPYNLFKESKFNIVRPRESILGDKKEPGNLNEITNFLIKETKDAYGLVISIDMLLYGGIVPSRLHYDTVETLEKRLSVLKKIKQVNPDIKIYAFQLIMRCPQYNSDDEEPSYYAESGVNIFKYGYIKQRIDLTLATLDELEYFNNIKIPKDHLDDFLDRRKINAKLNIETLNYLNNNIIDFLIIPQDDSSEFGWTALDQIVVRSKIEELSLQLKAYMYPGADEVANTLLSKLYCDMHEVKPRVYLKYPSISSGSMTPTLEDRYLDTTVRYQVLAAGGLVVSSISEANIVLCVNSPSDRMIDAPSQFTTKGRGFNIQRNMPEFLEFMDYAINEKNLPVIVADISCLNGGEVELLDMIRQKGLEMKIAGYAGWNTSSNSLGTCIPQGFIYLYEGNTLSHRSFLMSRYIEDIGYCSIVRSYVTYNVLPNFEGYNYFNIADKRGDISKVVKSELEKFVVNHLPNYKDKYIFKDCYMPWRRMFEVGIDIEMKK